MKLSDRRRSRMRSWVEVALAAVEPRRLTGEAITGADDDDVTVIAIGKAAPGMCWGAHDALGRIGGICVAGESAPVPPGVELVVGDHPLPRERSFEAGRAVLDMAERVEGRCIALVSGGGSALCEHPRPGLAPSYLTRVNEVMLDAGIAIDEMNLVRRHLSAIKGGGLAAVASAPIETYVISDVGRHHAALVASGPTIPAEPSPDRVEELLRSLGLTVDDAVLDALRQGPVDEPPQGRLTVLADGRTAGEAIARDARSAGDPGVLEDRWIGGDLFEELGRLQESASTGVSVAVGEPTLRVSEPGRGGRSTHAALMAATLLEGSDDVFMAFATDGADGRSGAAGAIVDGGTLRRGGDPGPALERFDSAAYLEASSDLLVTGPTGTNVSDIWVLWRP